jgi:hypothetical protein
MTLPAAGRSRRRDEERKVYGMDAGIDYQRGAMGDLPELRTLREEFEGR